MCPVQTVTYFSGRSLRWRSSGRRKVAMMNHRMRGSLVRTLTLRALAVGAVLMLPAAAFADAYADLLRVQAAFQNSTSWHAEEHFSNGKTTIVEHVAPDRWRVRPAPDITELVIGNDVYMVRNGKVTKLPVGGGTIRGMMERLAFSANDDVKASARDLGMRTVGGRSLHAYSYTVRGVPVTMYVGPGSLPVESVVHDKNGTTTIDYSGYNSAITIDAP
jgi:hypothetical protein